MKYWKLCLGLLALSAFGGCEKSAVEQEADAVRNDAQQQADVVREDANAMADNIREVDGKTWTGAAKDATVENLADNVEDAGEKLADGVEAQGEAQATAIEKSDDK